MSSYRTPLQRLHAAGMRIATCAYIWGWGGLIILRRTVSISTTLGASGGKNKADCVQLSSAVSTVKSCLRRLFRSSKFSTGREIYLPRFNISITRTSHYHRPSRAGCEAFAVRPRTTSLRYPVGGAVGRLEKPWPESREACKAHHTAPTNHSLQRHGHVFR